MKRSFLFVGFSLVITLLLAQAPEAINYQAVLRGSNNSILANQDVNLRISVVAGNINGTEVYKETHSTSTNQYGIVNLAIGTGTVITGVFANINWGGSHHFIKVEADTTDGTNYYDMGTSQLLSVPYSLYSQKTGDTSMWRQKTDSTIYYNLGNVGIGTQNPAEKFEVDGKIESYEGFKIDGKDGSNDTINQITAFDFTNNKLKYRTQIFNGGILVFTSDESGWVDSVGDYILPIPVPSNGLIAWYPFNGNANDESGNGHDGTVSGASLTSDRFLNANKAYDFNGSNSLISVLDDPDLDLNGNFSISSWFNADTIYDVPGTVKMILTKHRNGIDTDGYAYGLWNRDNSNAWQGIINFSASPYYTVQTYPEDSTGDVIVNYWYHYVVTYDTATDILSYYLNGTLADTVIIPFDILSNDQNLIIGAEYVLDGYGFKNYFNGTIDDIGIWARVLTPAEITAIYNGYAQLICGDTLVDTRDGQEYPTVQIGSQCWIARNMNIGTRINANENQTDNGIIEKYCYGDQEEMCNVTGGYYRWDEMMQYNNSEGIQGICPNGWHLPTDNEWKILEGTVDSQYPIGDPIWDQTWWRGLDAGGNLKEAGTTHWAPPNNGATNSSGFTALPGGYCADGGFGTYSLYGHFWCSSSYDSGNAWHRTLTSGETGVNRDLGGKASGISVRCLKN